MRLLFVCPSLAGGGAERQWTILLPRLAAAGFDVRVLTLDGEGPFFATLQEAGIPAYCARVGSRWDVAGLARAMRFAVAARADVVVTRSVSAQIFGHLAARVTRAVHVTTEHRPCDADRRFLRYSLHRRLLTRALAPRIDSVLAVTEAQRSACAWYGYQAARVQVIENGVPAPQSSAEPGSVRASLGLGPADCVAVLVAGLRPEKLVHDFVRAVQDAHAVEPRIRGLIVGDGSCRDEVEAQIAHAPGVTLLGFRRDVPDLMAAADVVCLTSSHEALPMVLLEAMALGRATIATDVGGVADVVVDRETGMIIPVASPGVLTSRLLELAATPGLGEALGSAGQRRHAERYTAERMVERHIEFFRELRPATSDHGR